MVAAGHGESLHGLAAGGQLVDNRYIQIAVQNQGQGPRDRGGGHDQRVGMGAFGGQGGPLGHAEAVLLVGDHQTQVRKFHSLG